MFSLTVHAPSPGSPLIASSIVVLVTLLLLAALVALALMALSRHKKSGTGPIQLLGAEGLVQADLRPDGAVLIKGELWRARSIDGTNIAVRERVEVAAVDGHLIVVKRYA
jgi:membrane-bound serine protease (ClpP class)